MRLIDANALLEQPLDIVNYPSHEVKEAPTVLTIPDNPTNGDVLIALYPNLRYTIQNNRVVTTIGVAASFDLDWWNSPYKRGNEDADTN